MFPGNRKELAESQSQNSIELENELGLPGSPVAKTPHFHWRGCRFMQGAAKKKKKKSSEISRQIWRISEETADILITKQIKIQPSSLLEMNPCLFGEVARKSHLKGVLAFSSKQKKELSLELLNSCHRTSELWTKRDSCRVLWFHFLNHTDRRNISIPVYQYPEVINLYSPARNPARQCHVHACLTFLG